MRSIDAAPAGPVISIRDLRTRCPTCGMRALCLPAGFTIDQMEQFDAGVSHRTKLKKHGSLYRTGETFRALHGIRIGSIKTVLLAEGGREQVMGYHMSGEVIGFDGIDTDRHSVGAIALEDTEVCTLSFAIIERLARTVPALQHNIHRMMSMEIAREHAAMVMLGSMHAEERLAFFLLNVADRYRRRGYSPTEYALQMTREEIGSYLGLELETVSRIFSRLHNKGLIHVQGRSVKLLDPIALRKSIALPA